MGYFSEHHARESPEGFVPGPGNYVTVMAEALAAGYNVFAGTWLGGSAAEAIGIVTTDSDRAYA
jgi:hypothetical protein